ncbi:MAG: hypothetical protein EBY20_02005 [Alphaproteobacteria bacterium]|uniref:Glycosyltransferase 2-like domain-containing protein n=1 Tax=viral metagenome TaxID=1070528 RepID=A0A6C0HQN3_9ZZZZ|nr:hypothetical protein [Alphaproteobacteria bacterium]
MNDKCICLICYKPSDVWVDFLSKFTKYDVYLIVDDNSKDYKEQYSNFSNINIIQINNEDCKSNGFFNMNYIMMKKDITSWDKSVYYFSTINTKYDKVWFLEDDVFFYDEETLVRLDSTYENSDLLSQSYEGGKFTGDKNQWMWKDIDIKFDPPYWSTMVCCVRMSSQLLSKIRNYANEHSTLFFIEALFPTICKRHNLNYDTPREMLNIIYNRYYSDNEIDKNNIYHPVKDLNKHKYYRYMLNQE